MNLRAVIATLASLLPVSCAGLRGDAAGPLPFKVAVIPFEVAVLPDGGDAKDEGTTIEPRFDGEQITKAVREALAGQFADAVILPWPADRPLEEFRRASRGQQDEYWMKACAAVDADLVLECDVKVPKRARCLRNEKFWLNLPVFLIGGPLCYFVSDTTYEGEARLSAVLHQVVPIERGRATLANRYAEVARCEVKFDRVSLDFLDRAEASSYLFSLVVPPGLLARSNGRVAARFASDVSEGLAAGLARDIEESASSILTTDSLADFYLLRGVKAVAAGAQVRVEGEVVVRSASAADLRDFVIVCGGRRVEGALEVAQVDALLSTGRDQFSRMPFAQSLALEPGVDRVRLELVQGGREQISRTFTIPVLNAPEPSR
jgi:hypothetical protein